MASPLLYLTDGTTIVNFISSNSGFHLNSWIPARVQPKSGGIFSGSPLSDGRKLTMRVWDNAGESFSLIVNGSSQDAVIADSRALSALALKSDTYWLSNGNLGGPVWMVRRASCETNTSYALVHAWSIPTEGGQILLPPFDAATLVALDEFTLNWERGHWLENPPGVGACVQISGLGSWYYWGANQLENPGFETAGGGGADVFANWTETAGDGAIARDLAVFHVTVPAGIASAKLTSGATSNTEITQAQAGLTPGSVAELGFWTRGSGAVDGRYGVYDVTNAAYILGLTSTGITAATFAYVGYSFTLPAGCTQVRVELWCPATNGAAAYFDDVELRIRGAMTTPGRAATCLNEVYISNKRVTAQLTDIYYYDASAGAYSANLLGAAVPFDILPAVPDENDIVYFGIDAGVPGAGPFDNLVFDITTAMVNVTDTDWQYWSAGAWNNFVPASIKDNTNQAGAETGVAFDTLGVNQVVWQIPSTTVTTINGIDAYWVRLIVNAHAGATTAPHQGNRDVYTCVWPSVLVDDAQVGGDLPALMETLLHNTSDAGAYIVWAGLRAVSRGADFTACLNANSLSNPAGVTVTLGAATAFITHSYSWAGQEAIYTIGAADALANRVTFTFSSALANQYWGKFRAFVRVSSILGGSMDDAIFRLVATYGSTGLSYSSNTITEAVSGVSFEIIDLGNIDIPGGTLLAGGETFDQVTISIQVGCTDAGGGDVNIYDLWLLPIDEWACQAGSVDATAVSLSYTDYLKLDSIEVPHTTFRSLEYGEASGEVIAYWRPIYSAPAMLQVRADQKVWFFTAGAHVVTGTASSYWDAYSVQMYRNQRYFGLRGTG